MSSTPSNQRPPADALLTTIADYIHGCRCDSALAWETAHASLLDSIGCAMEAQAYPACTRLLGPVVPGTVVPHGARVPGTPHRLDPVKAAFDIGALIRWLDFNDTWLAAEWGHPSDNLGAILAVGDWLSRGAVAQGRAPLTVRDVLHAMIQAHEIQGVLALDNAFNRVGLDHVLLVKVASTAVSARLLGLSPAQTVDALSLAFVDGQALRTYRHAPNTGSRKSWAAGDASARAVQLALMVQKGEMGYPSALSAPTWGFQDVLYRGRAVTLARPLGSYVMENVLFKISVPAEFHAQTAVEAALTLHQRLQQLGRSADDIERVTIRTQEAAVRIIDKRGPLHNPADRDHCIQYMVAVPLLWGRLTAADYEDAVAADPRIDALRERIDCVHEPAFSADYLDPDKRSIANALTVTLRDGSTLPEVRVDYPLGHRRRRAEGQPHLRAKFEHQLEGRFGAARAQALAAACTDLDRLQRESVNDFVDRFCE